MMAEKNNRAKIFLNLNFLLCLVLAFSLISYWLRIYPFRNEGLIIFISIIATFTVFIGAVRSLKYKKLSIDLLAAIALVFALIEGEWVSALFINLMIASARTFINFVKIRSHSALSGLMKLKPEKVKIRHDGGFKEVPIASVKKGDSVIIDLGEMIPVDGMIIEGDALIDQSSLTGESMPVSKKKGEKVLSFTTIVSGSLVIKAEKVGEDTNFEKIIKLVEQAQVGKAPINAFVDKFANWYIVCTLLGAAVVYILFKDINLILALLLVSCADDIAVATPLALMTSIVHSARHGAIIKGGDFLEGLTKLKVVIFDKTGTLTKGKLKIESIFPLGENSKEDVLKTAAMASIFSTHPIAKTIVEHAKKENIKFKDPEQFEEYGGKGMTAVYRNKKIIVGKMSFLNDLGVHIDEKQTLAVNSEEAKGCNVTLVGYGDELIGYLALFDELRPKIKQTMDDFRKLGVEKIVMLTGDNEKIAEKVADIIGIDDFHANLLPKDKLKYLKKYLNSKYKVAMVGDGVNDAPVLAMSDIGIAMGAIGSDAAIEAADVAMMKDDLSQIPEIIK
ncbi:MAG: cation-translocating P-type ATPase, partial [Candidatus Nealsonbacteria bacterium]|nr:cation-translocating P-type ATPase [Candidatus Nealsonbacteria bacterium]